MVVELQEIADSFSCYTSSLIEAQFIHNEIWNDGCYDGPKMSDEEPFIIDAGANIGLFTIYMKQKHPKAKIMAFEPVPETFETMRRNLALHKITGVETHQCGLGPKATTAKLTHYPNFPGNSTQRPETKASTIKAVTERFGKGFAEAGFGNAEVLEVEIQPLSKFLVDETSGRVGKKAAMIDLLKIDVEGAELGVLQGLSDAHWETVRNVVLETTGSSGDVATIEELLQGKGFIVKREVAAFEERGTDEFFVVHAFRGIPE